MKTCFLCRARLGILLSMLLAPLGANAYWVQGQGQIGGGASENPLIVNGATSSIGKFATPSSAASFLSEADLASGTLKGRTTIGTPSIGAFGQAVAVPQFGETVTFNASEPGFWDFSFSTDVYVNTAGGFDGSNVNPPFTSFDFTSIFFELYIFEGYTVGPTGSGNFWGDAAQAGEAIFGQSISLTPGSPTEWFDLTNMLFSDTISGSIPLNTGLNSFDIVGRMFLSSSARCCVGPAYVSLDALNTASFSIDSATPFTSESGVFLTGRTPVPEPGSLAMTTLGLLGLLLARSKKYKTDKRAIGRNFLPASRSLI